MKGNERLERFLELQSKNIVFEDISKELGITVKTLRGFLNKQGYKLEDGKYQTKQSKDIKQIEFIDTKNEEKKTKKNSSKIKVADKENKSKKSTAKEVKAVKELKEAKVDKVKKSKPKVKKDRKINITPEDLDKLCEVYDWYLEVKDYKCMKPKTKPSVKDINIEESNTNEFKSTSMKIEKKVWEDFERLCSNSNYSKQEIFTQALKDFMKEYKHLL